MIRTIIHAGCLLPFFLLQGCATPAPSIAEEEFDYFQEEKWRLEFTDRGVQFYARSNENIQPLAAGEGADPREESDSLSPLDATLQKFQAENKRARGLIHQQNIMLEVRRANCAAQQFVPGRPTPVYDSEGKLVGSVPTISRVSCSVHDRIWLLNRAIEEFKFTNRLIATAVSGDLVRMRSALLRMGSIQAICVPRVTPTLEAEDCLYGRKQAQAVGELLEIFLRISAQPTVKVEERAAVYSARSAGEGLAGGMSGDEVRRLKAWGEPEHGVNAVVMEGLTQEQWIYKAGDKALDYVFLYFENDRLVPANEETVPERY